MTAKTDLIFDWVRKEKKSDSKITPLLIVTAVFTIFFGLIQVRVQPFEKPILETAEIMHFSDNDLGRAWRQRAEEDGPFPGRLEIGGTVNGGGDSRLSSLIGFSDLSSYGSVLRKFQTVDGNDAVELAENGRKFLPERISIPEPLPRKSPAQARILRRPILTPFDGEALRWMPDALPEFKIKAEGGFLVSGSWRFMLSLRLDGSVAHCVSLSGGDEPGLAETADWLRGIRFKSGSGERWLGLRVEFVN